jgi:hypothetical protein
MKLVTDNAFTKAWKDDCPTCKNSKLWFRERCHECERTYSRKELSMAMYETWIATHTKAESFDGIARIVLAKLNGREPE